MIETVVDQVGGLSLVIDDGITGIVATEFPESVTGMGKADFSKFFFWIIKGRCCDG
ncbi:MAG: hypothetical protein AAF443_00640 [Chlamydiota bacterium]